MMQEPKKRSNLSILLQKSLIIQYANLRSYIALYLSPLVILLCLMLYQYVADHNNKWEKPDPPAYKLDPIPICGGTGCKTIAYAVIGQREPYIDYVLEHLKKQNNLPDTHVEQWDRSPKEIMDHLERYPNKTQNVIVFCTSRWQVQDNFSVPCFADHYHLNFYTIIYNLSLFFRTPYLGNLRQSYPKDKVVLRLKQDIDQAILKFYANSTLDLQLQDYPSRSSRFLEGLNVVYQYGSFFFLIPYLILFVLEVSSALREKEQGLRIGLSTVGVTAFQFYLSNLIMSLLNNLLITSFFCLFGYLLDFKFFTHGLLWFDMLTLTCNGMLMSLIGLMIVSMVKQKKIGMSVSYAFVLYSIVMQWMFTGGFLMLFIYQQTNTRWIKAIRVFFNLYPSFHYSKIFSDVERKADRHFDSFDNKWIEGQKFTYEDLFTVTKGDTSIMKSHYQIPSTIGSLYNLLLTSILYIVLLWYFDHVVESNRGKGAHPLFFLQKKFWCREKNNASVGVYQRAEVRNALKCFRKHMYKSSSEDVFALKGASFEVEANQIVSILGKNGAGKSTMIGVLTGIIQLDSGTAHICGMNVDTHMDLLRKRLGICPQFDILWDDLTAEEHLRMFGQLKRIQNLEQEINQSLRQVQLEANRNGRIKTFSGGMKRRVSLAISLLGKPDLIILDEPTTGMDPKVRKLTWNIIRSLKSHASIIITTHNMEQADCLSDRIMVMASGRILAQGTSTALKRQFGSGYTLRIICKDPIQVKNQLMRTGIKCDVEDRDIIIKSSKEEELATILQYLEKEKSTSISQWFISESTLQDVFLSVNRRY